MFLSCYYYFSFDKSGLLFLFSECWSSWLYDYNGTKMQEGNCFKTLLDKYVAIESTHSNVIIYNKN